MNIAVSACLLGVPCRFDGEARPCAAVQKLREDGEHTVVPICPESGAGLSIPRSPNEIVAAEEELRVVDSDGVDNTAAFVRGAKRAFEKARKAGCTCAILKAKSPSCGSGRIYDGTFTGTLVEGWGVAARMFRDAGIQVIDEKTFECEGLPCE